MPGGIIDYYPAYRLFVRDSDANFAVERRSMPRFRRTVHVVRFLFQRLYEVVRYLSEQVSACVAAVYAVIAIFVYVHAEVFVGLS